MEPIKKKRMRLNESHFWIKTEIESLLDYIFQAIGNDPKKFEKPCARVFYETHCKKGLLEDIDWQTMKSKMRYFHVLFLKANKWLNEVGTELFKSDTRHIESRLNSICPYYNEIKIIFESRVLNDPIRVPYKNNHINESNEKTGLKHNEENNQNNERKLLFKMETDFEDSCTRSENISIIHEEDDAEEEEQIYTPNQNNILENNEISRNRKELWNLRREKLLLERDKFTFECEQHKERLDIQRLQINLEKEKFEFEKQKFHDEQQLRKYEIEKNFELKKLEIEKNEHLQRLELEYKYNKQQQQTNNDFLKL